MVLGGIGGFIIAMFIVAVYFDEYHWFTSPQECFVNEMNKWKTDEKIDSTILNETNPDLLISRLRVVIKEFDFDKLDGDERRIYARSLTLFDYCKLDKDIQ
jgi:hypothetical protein